MAAPTPDEGPPAPSPNSWWNEPSSPVGWAEMLGADSLLNVGSGAGQGGKTGSRTLTRADLESRNLEHQAVPHMQGSMTISRSSPISPSMSKRVRRMSLGRRRRTPSVTSLTQSDFSYADTTKTHDNTPERSAPPSTNVQPPRSHKHTPHQASTSSSAEFNMNQMWKSDEVWEGEAVRLESEIEELNTSFNQGHLRAFGHTATAVYGQLEQMRRAQYELFEKHVEFESALLADLGTPATSAESSEGKGFDQGVDGGIDSEAHSLLNAMNGVCKSIQSFTASNSSRRPRRSASERE
eukprot:m.63676 g.63676  ORF g.63676 m.63676 type:complete len:295 (-) comp8171_c0_seq2:150-1034(-)